MPIISTSVSIPSDEIIRGCAPTQRQPYDQDLKVFRDQLHKSVQHEAQTLSAAKADKTDILGTMDLVDQELALDTGEVRQRVVVFSDFIEEDDSRNFIRAIDLSDVAAAATLARDLAYRKAATEQKQTPWTGVPVLLAVLQSFDLPRLPEQRRQGIRQFWMEYFETRNAVPTYVYDGPGMCGRFLAQ